MKVGRLYAHAGVSGKSSCDSPSQLRSLNKIRANTAPKGATVGERTMIASKIGLFSAYLAFTR